MYLKIEVLQSLAEAGVEEEAVAYEFVGNPWARTSDVRDVVQGLAEAAVGEEARA